MAVFYFVQNLFHKAESLLMDQYELKFILENWKDQEWHEDDVDLFKKDEKDEKGEKVEKDEKGGKGDGNKNIIRETQLSSINRIKRIYGQNHSVVPKSSKKGEANSWVGLSARF